MPRKRIFKTLEDLHKYFKFRIARSDDKMNWNSKVAKLVWDARQAEIDFLNNKIVMIIEFLDSKDISAEELSLFRQQREKCKK